MCYQEDDKIYNSESQLFPLDDNGCKGGGNLFSVTRSSSSLSAFTDASRRRADTQPLCVSLGETVPFPFGYETRCPCRGSKGERLIDFGVELVVETGKRREERRLQEP